MIEMVVDPNGQKQGSLPQVELNSVYIDRGMRLQLAGLHLVHLEMPGAVEPKLEDE